MSIDLGPWGLAVGHATDEEGGTGLTVIRGPEQPFRAAAAVIGRATGTRELQALSPTALAGRVDAILLTGGSAYGLDAAAGVMRWMEERGRGFPVPGGVVPIVPAAVIFDLAPLGRYSARPTADMAYAACEGARPDDIPEGAVGAGTGATVGKAAGPEWLMKSGIGCAVARSEMAGVAAIAVVNAFGDVRDADGAIIAGARKAGGGFLDATRLLANGAIVTRFGDSTVPHTTLAVVAVDAAITRLELGQLATAASAALYRRITPVGTSFDGDIIFAVCPLGAPSPRSPEPPLPHLEALAVQALELAVERSVRTARGRDGVPGLADGAPPRASVGTLG